MELTETVTPPAVPSTAAESTFDVKQYSDLQKTMGKEEYMKFVMNKFLESKHKAKVKAKLKEKEKEVKKEAEFAYEDDLRAMLKTFGDPLPRIEVIHRMEEIARDRIREYLQRLSELVQKSGRSAQKKRRRKPPKKPEKEKEAGETEEAEEKEKKRTNGEEGKKRLDAEEDEIADEWDDATLPTVTLEDLAVILQKPEKIRRMGYHVAYMRQSKLQPDAHRLDENVDYVQQLLGGAAEDEEELSTEGNPKGESNLESDLSFDSRVVSLAAVLTEPFWGKSFAISEEELLRERLERLQHRDALTKRMSQQEYLEFAEMSKISFTRPRKRNKLLKWAAVKDFPIRLANQSELIDVLGQLLYDYCEKLTWNVLARTGDIGGFVSLPQLEEEYEKYKALESLPDLQKGETVSLATPPVKKSSSSSRKRKVEEKKEAKEEEEDDDEVKEQAEKALTVPNSNVSAAASKKKKKKKKKQQSAEGSEGKERATTKKRRKSQKKEAKAEEKSAVTDAVGSLLQLQPFEDLKCKKCNSGEDEEVMLMCDRCDAPYHIFCLDRPLKKVPKGDWFCAECKAKGFASTPGKSSTLTAALSKLIEQQEKAADNPTTTSPLVAPAVTKEQQENSKC